MKRFIQFVTGLYPASWRRRYGIEFAALLEDMNPDWQTFLDVLRGAVEMHMRTWNFGKILAIGIAGALLGLIAWFAIPNRYSSAAVLKIMSAPLPPDYPATNGAIAEYVNSIAEQSMSRSSLTQIIRTLKLYEPEQAKIPLEDIVGGMKKNITIRPVGRHSDKGATEFSIQFIYSDPVIAQRVVQELAARFLHSALDFSLRENKPSAGGVTLQMINAPSLTNRPFSPRLPMIMTAGAAAGLALGALLALVRRSLRPARSIQPR